MLPSVSRSIGKIDPILIEGRQEVDPRLRY